MKLRSKHEHLAGSNTVSRPLTATAELGSPRVILRSDFSTSPPLSLPLVLPHALSCPVTRSIPSLEAHQSQDFGTKSDTYGGLLLTAAKPNSQEAKHRVYLRMLIRCVGAIGGLSASAKDRVGDSVDGDGDGCGK